VRRFSLRDGPQGLYADVALAQCPNLIRLETPDAIRLDGTTLVLHLVPIGEPQRGPPRNEAVLRQAVRGVLSGIKALHSAGTGVHRRRSSHQGMFWAHECTVSPVSLTGLLACLEQALCTETSAGATSSGCLAPSVTSRTPLS
jgi:hypothetical protein